VLSQTQMTSSSCMNLSILPTQHDCRSLGTPWETEKRTSKSRRLRRKPHEAKLHCPIATMTALPTLLAGECPTPARTCPCLNTGVVPLSKWKPDSRRPNPTRRLARPKLNLIIGRGNVVSVNSSPHEVLTGRWVRIAAHRLITRKQKQKCDEHSFDVTPGFRS